MLRSASAVPSICSSPEVYSAVSVCARLLCLFVKGSLVFEVIRLRRDGIVIFHLEPRLYNDPS